MIRIFFRLKPERLAVAVVLLGYAQRHRIKQGYTWAYERARSVRSRYRPAQ